jgi:putative hydrolase of the HAD superfamily
VMGPANVILWDFDYTLGFRGDLARDEARIPWGACLIEILDAEEPGHQVSTDDVRPYLHDGFPWHRHADPHLDLCDGDAWWRSVEPVFARALEGVGVVGERSTDLARLVRRRFADSTAWSLYPDTLPVLRALRETGWSHVIVSNHVPELEQIITALGLAELIDHVLCSAITGYEKPHPEAFDTARRRVGSPKRLWMVGDNPVADVQGAEAVGIPAIQVRMRRAEGVRRYAEDLHGVVEIVTSLAE